MANYRLRDLNRFRKVYPYRRAPPRYAYVYDAIVSDGGNVEAGKITFADADTASYSFATTYSVVPSVVISTVDTVGNKETNVTVTVTSISTTSVTVTASAKFTGQVHIHIVAVP
jgi:hypothetical protein